MDIEKLDINAVCFGILCNFTPVCGEEKAKEAANLCETMMGFPMHWTELSAPGTL